MTGEVVEGHSKMDFHMTSVQARELLEKLRDRDELRRFLGDDLGRLEPYGIQVEEDNLFLEGTEQAPHHPPHEVPSKELVDKIRDAIQHEITTAEQNPPMFAICSRIAIIAYISAASPPN
jgi:hypothetical protein